MLRAKPLLFILSIFTTATSLALQPTALNANNLIDQNNPSSDYWIIQTLDLFERNNIPVTKENLSTFFIQLK